MRVEQKRSRYLQALGLTDWALRPDGPLAASAADAGRRAALPPAEKTGAPPTLSRPLVPVSQGAAGDAPAVPGAAVVTERDHAVLGYRDSPSEQAAAPPAAGADNRAVDMDWDALEAYLAEQDHRGAARPVFGTGARDADVLIVGEAPGAQEDEQGLPFVGRAGRLLDKMLFAIGASRETNVYITNICKFRPPNNRDPKPDEVAADWPILERQIELMDPKLVVAVGRVAAQTLLDSKQSLGRLRGRLHRYPRRELDVLVTYHPAYLLRSPQQKNKAWDDLKLIAARIGHADAGGARP